MDLLIFLNLGTLNSRFLVVRDESSVVEYSLAVLHCETKVNMDPLECIRVSKLHLHRIHLNLTHQINLSLCAVEVASYRNHMLEPLDMLLVLWVERRQKLCRDGHCNTSEQVLYLPQPQYFSFLGLFIIRYATATKAAMSMAVRVSIINLHQHKNPDQTHPLHQIQSPRLKMEHSPSQSRTEQIHHPGFA